MKKLASDYNQFIPSISMAHRVQALLSSTQKTLSEWNQKIHNAIETKEEERLNYQAKKQQLLPQLIEATEKGVSTRELAKITGINHTTIGRWIREARKKKEKENVGADS
jgi:DNA invertase Pin-like site-specific DNA recombinase